MHVPLLKLALTYKNILKLEIKSVTKVSYVLIHNIHISYICQTGTNQPLIKCIQHVTTVADPGFQKGKFHSNTNA